MSFEHQVREAMRARKELDAAIRARPRELLNPFDNPGQMGFLQSRHIYRLLHPGNGFGKTTVMAMDVDMLIQGDDPFKPEIIPKNKERVVVWITKKYQQWQIIREPIERKVFTAGWTWNETYKVYKWPGKGKMFVFSGESDWELMQGPEPDLIVFDEHPPLQMWKESIARRRGSNPCRFTVGATLTTGITWYVRDMIQPWEQHHKLLGLSMDQAHEKQLHPDVWCWLRGGIRDNPSMTEKDFRFYERAFSSQSVSSKEKEVRLRGGYADLAGDGVFDAEALSDMRDHLTPVRGSSKGMTPYPASGTLHHVALSRLSLTLEEASRASGASDLLRIASLAGSSVDAKALQQLQAQSYVHFQPEGEIEGGRITVWEPPDANSSYVIGADFAQGLVGRDYDAAVVLKIRPDGVFEQVAELHGWWGDVFFARSLFLACVWYWQAFFCGERQVGLPAMRIMWDEYGYRYMYRGRNEALPNRRSSDALGHHRSKADPTLGRLRLAIRNRQIIVRSPELHAELCNYQWRPKSSAMDPSLAHAEDMVSGAPEGMHDDLVMALLYAYHGGIEAPRFEAPPRQHVQGTFGSVLSSEAVFNPPVSDERIPV